MENLAQMAIKNTLIPVHQVNSPKLSKYVQDYRPNNDYNFMGDRDIFIG